MPDKPTPKPRWHPVEEAEPKAPRHQPWSAAALFVTFVYNSHKFPFPYGSLPRIFDSGYHSPPAAARRRVPWREGCGDGPGEREERAPRGERAPASIRRGEGAGVRGDDEIAVVRFHVGE